MEIFQRMVNTQLVFLAYMAAGFILCRRGKFGPQQRGGLLNLLLYVVLPCMIVNSFSPEMGAEAFRGSLEMIAVVAAITLFGLLAGYAVFRRRAPEQRGVLLFATMFSNMGNAGLPVISMVFGQTGVLYGSMALIPVVVLMWTVGLSLFMPGVPMKTRLRKMLNPNMLAIILGFLRVLTGVKLPAPVGDALGSLGAMAAPLAMLVVGATLAEIPPRELITRDSLFLSAMRLCVLPLLTLGALRLLGASQMTTAVAVVIAAMPAASNTAIFAASFGGDEHLASRCVALSTLCAIVTVPLVALLL